MRKKVDSRIRTLIENGVKESHRSMFVIVGEKARDQVVNLHYMLSKASVKARPSVLWCYKKDLGFSSHHKKRARQIQKEVKRGIRDADDEDPFELFLTSTDIRYCYYKDTHKVLGSTHGVVILQDFEALTPNALARTIETVSGGGLVIFLLQSLTSLQQLSSLVMDVHSKFTTDAHQTVQARFNNRFLLSLTQCKKCLVLNDELDILPMSPHAADIEPVQGHEFALSPGQVQLKELSASMTDTPGLGKLVPLCKTVDQAHALLSFAEQISEKNLTATVSLTSARGRGKSCGLGLGLAFALFSGFGNIFVTAPLPQNLGSAFEMLIKALKALNMEEHRDFEVVEGTAEQTKGSIVRVNVFNKDHRQSVQYIRPQEFARPNVALLSHCELLAIDEAAAIPLPLVQNMLGHFLVFFSSTIHGYEGTGRSLSLKLLSKLRADPNRLLTEVTMEEPIRYGLGDQVECWLNALLCFPQSDPQIEHGTPPPDQCELFVVNRDTLFSGHAASESFLLRMMALYVSSHYKNTPNDLQLMADAPAHRLFVLLGPKLKQGLPDILAVVQVCLEGKIGKEVAQSALGRGDRPSGDLIPWVISQQFQDYEFASLSGARIVRIATHPELQRMGYGSKAVELLTAYYSGETAGLPDVDMPETGKLPPLLQALDEQPSEELDYIGTSFGVTESLFGFWNKKGMVPVYCRQTPSDLTGEHTMIMLHALRDQDWATSFTRDFQRRFTQLLGYGFRDLTPSLALAILHQRSKATVADWNTLRHAVTEYDLKRLDVYSRNLVEYHMILDLVPRLAGLYFEGQIPIDLSLAQSAILVGMGLQRKSVADLEQSLRLAGSQVLAAFNKALRKLKQYVQKQLEAHLRASLPAQEGQMDLKPTFGAQEAMEKELAEAGSSAVQAKANLLQGLHLEQYAIDRSSWDASVPHQTPPSAVSVKASTDAKKRKQHKKSTKGKKVKK